MFDFKNKVAVVTGGARGIGKIICQEFRKAGAEVCTIDLLDNEDLRKIAERVSIAV